MKILITIIFTCLFFSNTFSQAPVFGFPSNTFFMNGLQSFVKVQNGYLGVRKYSSMHKNIHKPHLNRANISVVNYDDKMVELSENKFSGGEFVYGMLEPQIIKGEKKK